MCEAGNARAKLGELVLAKRAKSADDMCEVVRGNGALLRSMDDYWSLENALLRSLCGSTAEQRVSTSILSELPAADRGVEMARCLARLEAMAAAPSLKLAPIGVQAGLRFIIKNLAALVQGISLSENIKSCSSLVRKALCSFQFFLQIEREDKKGEFMRGEQAYAWLWTDCTKHIAAKKEIKDFEAEQLELFIWIAEPGTHDAIVAFLKSRSDAAGKSEKASAKKSAAAATSSKASSSASGNVPPGKKQNLGKENAMRYFS